MEATITDTQVDTQPTTDSSIIALVDGYKVTQLATLDDFPFKVEPIARKDEIRWEGCGEEEGRTEEVASQIRVQWTVSWNTDAFPVENPPNAIAFVDSYPGDYTEIGRYEQGQWTTYGYIDGFELLLPHWERHTYMISWKEAYASYPRMYVLNPSHTETPGGKGEDFRHYLAMMCETEAFKGAAVAFGDAYGEGRGAVFHKNDNSKMLAGYPLLSFEVDDPQNEQEKIIINVRMKLVAADVAIRKPGDPLPEWATEEKYERERAEQRKHLSFFD